MNPNLYARFQRLLGTLEGIAISMENNSASDMILNVCSDLDNLIDAIDEAKEKHNEEEKE